MAVRSVSRIAVSRASMYAPLAVKLVHFHAYGSFACLYSSPCDPTLRASS